MEELVLSAEGFEIAAANIELQWNHLWTVDD